MMTQALCALIFTAFCYTAVGWITLINRLFDRKFCLIVWAKIFLITGATTFPIVYPPSTSNVTLSWVIGIGLLVSCHIFFLLVFVLQDPGRWFSPKDSSI